MGRLSIREVFDLLSCEQVQKLSALKDDVLENKRFSRAQRRNLKRNWRKYAKQAAER